ncbi:MAG: hypothetical protein M0Z47_09445, partial [Actinomycetota bacterium]|nr:hypothetical protein [Actinomycetota bacterium]
AAGIGRRTALVGLSHSRAAAEVLRALGEEDPVLAAIAPKLRVFELRPEEILVEYLQDHGMAGLGRRLISTGVVSVISTAIPGIRELLVLAKLKQMERSGEFDSIILDAPASGHLLTFLSSPKGLADIANVGLLRTQADEVQALLSDPSRSQLVLVTLAEETPVSETSQTYSEVESQGAIALGPIVANALQPPIGLSRQGQDALTEIEEPDDRVDAFGFVSAKVRLQEENLAELRRKLPACRLAQVPFVYATELGIGELARLAEHLLSEASDDH